MLAARAIQQNSTDPVRILLIEGEHACTDRIYGALEHIDWTCARIEAAASLRQALARLRLEKFDLVISALDLPDARGLATVDALARAFDRLIIVLTEAQDAALRERVIAHGAFDLLPADEVSTAALERLLQLAAQTGSVRSLRDSEARFRRTLELAGSGLAHLDLEGRFLRVNHKLCEILGYAEGELVGCMLRGLAHPEDAQIAGTERRYLRKDGATVWFQVNAALVRDAAGEPHYEICVFEDISERKRVEARQAAHARYQEAIGRFSQSALGRHDASELVAAAVETAKRALGAREVWYVALGAGAMPVAPARAALVPVQGEGVVRGLLCVDAEEISAEALAFLNTVASLLSTGLQRIDSEGRLSFLAQFDPLTGLANRALATERLALLVARAKREAAPLAVLSVNLDDFNLINETLGHPGGDELLKETAMRLLGAVRNGDTVARLSGDQFVVLLAELARAEDTAGVAQKILERLAQPFTLGGNEAFVTASVGIATCPGDGESAEGLLSAAAAAMYRAKQSGRNSYRFFTSEITQRTRVRARLGLELRRALERNEFALVYQPKIDLASSLPCGAEALLRWHHPERGVMSPAQFIPVLEETGLIVPVGEWVIARACEDIKAWRAAGLKVLPVAVNLSARQFRQQALDRRIHALVQGAGVAPGLIELEITESQLMEDPEHAIRVMRALRDSGIRAAIDDFGTGYSSLAYLTRLPLAALKIDRSFVADALTDAADAAIVRTIIEMAHTLDFTVVAEGVETDAQMAFLRQFGCEQGQGFLFARPMSAADFRALI